MLSRKTLCYRKHSLAFLGFYLLQRGDSGHTVLCLALSDNLNNSAFTASHQKVSPFVAPERTDQSTGARIPDVGGVFALPSEGFD